MPYFLNQQRFDNEDKKKYRSVWISDVHLGTKYSNTDILLKFLKEHEFEYLYIVGDFIDGWELSRKWWWDENHNLLIQKILRLSRKGVKVIYIPGNHDEFMRTFIDHTFGGIEIINETVHTCLNGKKYLIIHGDIFDGILTKLHWVSKLGSFLYQLILDLNYKFNKIRHKLGYGYWSLSSYIKRNTKKAVIYISSFEDTLIEYAKKKSVSGIIAGHIHSPYHKTINDIEYINTGCWVEMATAVVEDYDGNLKLITLL